MTSAVSESSLNDPYPVGWILVYRDRDSVGTRRNTRKAGVVTGDPARDPGTGAELIPLADLEDTTCTPSAWIEDADVIGIEPRSPGRG